MSTYIAREMSTYAASLTQDDLVYLVTEMAEELGEVRAQLAGQNSDHTPKPPAPTREALLRATMNKKAENQCPICLDQVMEPIQVNCCKGIFCKTCLNDCRASSPNCPLCRRDLDMAARSNASRAGTSPTTRTTTTMTTSPTGAMRVMTTTVSPSRYTLPRTPRRTTLVRRRSATTSVTRPFFKCTHADHITARTFGKGKSLSLHLLSHVGMDLTLESLGNYQYAAQCPLCEIKIGAREGAVEQLGGYQDSTTTRGTAAAMEKTWIEFAYHLLNDHRFSFATL